jgi:hypothetical protein
MPSESDYLKVQTAAAGRLLAIPGVHMVALGSKVKSGAPTFETAILVYTTRKRPLTEITEAERIPAEIAGIPTDVVETPEFQNEGSPGVPADEFRNDGQNAHDRGRHRPLSGGVRVQAETMGWGGTLGFFLTPIGATSRGYAVTNYHVVSGSLIDLPADRQVGQSTNDSSSWGCCDDIIGRVKAYANDRTLDFAIIELRPEAVWKPSVPEIGAVAGVRGPITAAEATARSVEVVKRGFRTGLTGGVVIAVNAILPIEGHDVSGLVVIAPNPLPDPAVKVRFSARGDSGSAILTAAGREIVGLLRSGNGDITVATPIAELVAAVSAAPPGGLGVPMAVAVAASADEVRTVPASPMVAAEEPRIAPEALAALEAVRATPLGAWYVELYQRHREELVALVNRNRKVATAWHRSGTAEIFQTLRRAPLDKEARVPERVRDRVVMDALQSFAAVLVRHASDALASDVRLFAATLPNLAGLGLDDLVSCLSARPSTAEPSAKAA